MIIISIGVAANTLFSTAYARPQNAIASITVQRFSTNPLITLESDTTLQNNVDGPSVIKVPTWVANPLGKYYLYFANHTKTYIRLAYADSLKGPWKIYQPGTLHNSDASALGFDGHVASPDVHIDESRKRILMYFHGAVGSTQKTTLAYSTDGIKFQLDEHARILSPTYYKVFSWQDTLYAIAKTGDSSRILKSMLLSDSSVDFVGTNDHIYNHRHGAVTIRGNFLLWFYSRQADIPERILVKTVEMKGDYNAWEDSDSLEVLKPELAYEGATSPLVASVAGPEINVNEVRDPCIYEEGGKVYLFYSIAGESGIAAAELTIAMRATTPVVKSDVRSLNLAPSVSNGSVEGTYDIRGRRIHASTTQTGISISRGRAGNMMKQFLHSL